MGRTAFPPVAILGYGCRFPGGVSNGQGFWEMLRLGRDAVGEIPSDRWSIDAHCSSKPGVAGRSLSRWGGFLDRIDEFEPECFGISPREAAFVDPQQRLLLETTWDALELAGLPVSRLAKSRTGVFVGISNVDYGHIQSSPNHQRGLGAFTALGSSASIAANRISYCLDLRGPSMSVDTACSSSLVALDIALKHLCIGQADLAIAGGVNVVIMPETFIMFSSASMLSPDGRCKAFDASANGFVRGEGAGVVILKRLEDALRDHDPIQAVIVASGTNQDGRTGGISLPNVDAQELLLRNVYSDSGIGFESVGYVEAHGTGTPVGDPAEAEALGRVFAASHANGSPLYIGSVKTNIGHLESGSGIASVIKAVLMVQHRQIPPSLHFREPNPAIDFDRLRLSVPTSVRPWPGDRPAVIGVNSFGFGGANAHVVLSEFYSEHRANGRRIRPLPKTVASVKHENCYPILLTARSPEALNSLARSWDRFLTEGELVDADLPDISYSALHRRTGFRYRLGFAASGISEACGVIQTYLRDESTRGVYVAEAPHRPPQIAFVFCGQGAHWYGMGRQLLQNEPVFRKTIEHCDDIIRAIAGWSIVDELKAGDGNGRLERTSIAQPILFAIQTALDALWRSWGIEPAAVVGHSVGELAAAHASGALSFETAACIVAHRGACLEGHARPGKMMAAAMSESGARELADELSEAISVAAINSPHMVTLAGDAPALARLGATLDSRAVWWKPLAVQLAFHTSSVDPACSPFLEAIGTVASRDFAVPFISTVTGKALEPGALTADYWWDNMRHPVRFSDAIQELIGRGVQIFLEVGPHPVLGGSIRQCRPQAASPVTVLPSLRRDEDETHTMRSSLAGLYAHGVEANSAALWPEGGKFIELPAHPWVKQKYWHECPEIRNARLAPDYHPLLGRRAWDVAQTWQASLNTSDNEWLRDHAVGGQVLFPAAGFVEIALAAATRTLAADTCTIDELVIRRGLFLSNESTSVLQTTVDVETSSIAVDSRAAANEGDWIAHIEATFRALSTGIRPVGLVPHNRKRDADIHLSSADCYRLFREMGLEYGRAFQSIVEIYQGSRWALGLVEASDETAESTVWHVHPTLLDGCFQVLLGTVPREALLDNYIMLPDRIERIDFRRRPGGRAWCEARLTAISPGRIVGDVRVFRADGEPAIDIIGFQCQAVPRARRRETQPIEKCFLRKQWRHKPLPNSGAITVPLDDLDLREMARDADVARTRLGEEASSESIERGYRYNDSLARAYIAQALKSIGFNLEAGESIDVDTLIGSGKLLERFRPHFSRCVRGLCETLPNDESNGPRWTLPPNFAYRDLDSLWLEALAVLPECYRQFRLIEICGRRLPEIWSGALDPLDLLFSSECVDLLEHAYQDSTSSRNTNIFIQRLIARLVSALPANRPIRILEVGAGTAGTTIYVAPVLPRHRSEYWFTDVSPFFMARADEKLGRYDFMRYRQFDIERPLAEQDIPSNTFDVVIAAHVLHATRDVRGAVRHCREALVDGGLLIATEISITPLSFDLVFGLTEGWRYFREDPARPNSPHLSRHEWLALLEKEGFEQNRASGDEHDRQVVFVGRKSCSQSIDAFPLPAIEGRPPEPNWVVFSDAGGHGGAIAAKLRERKMRCIEVHFGLDCKAECVDVICIDPQDDQAMVQLHETCRAEFSGEYSVLYLWPLDIPATDIPSEADVNVAEMMACHCAVGLIQAFGSTAEHAARRLLFVTRGAQVLPSETNPAAFLQAPLYGLARVAANEFAALKFRMIDVDPAANRSSEPIWGEMVADDNEEEVAWRGIHRFIPRLEFASPAAAKYPNLCDDNHVPFKLVAGQLGNLSSLELRETRPRAPGPNEIEVDIHWAALNFKDVLRALSRNEIAEQVELGMESAGTIRAVGESVTHLQEGVRVVFCGSNGIASRLTVHADYAAKIPEGMSTLAAVTMPVAFITADYALREVGRLREGESVLIHSAAGGVGLAAVQLARRAGARIYTTAGSCSKRELLAKFGVERTMDSRSLDFSDEILHDANAQGIDVVLNSLAGQAMRRSLACLRPFGRFLELGKRDFWENTKIGLWPLRNNVSYHAIDVAPFLNGPPDSRVVAVSDVIEQAAAGEISPLPVEVFPVARATDAFRFMAQGSHVGKVVLDMTQHWGKIQQTPPPVKLRSDATYLVTGAFGGLGLVLLRWLVESGAKHLMLLSRSGPQTDASHRYIDELRQRGVDMHVRLCDVGDFAQLEAVFAEIEEQMPELAGIFHLAMVLDDGAITNMNRSRFCEVMRPKFRGACNLHRLCWNMTLDLFVLFSSASASVGFPGQSNYAAANAGVESLAAFRRTQGLPGISIAWGVLGDVGYAAARPEILQQLRKSGYYEIGTADFIKGLELALGANEPNQGIARADWQIEVQKLRTRGNRQALLTGLVDIQDVTGALAPGLARERILAAPPEQRAQIAGDVLRELAARVLGMGADKIETDKPLADLGFDSLMAIELVTQVESQLGVSFPLRSLGDEVTLVKLSEFLVRTIAGPSNASVN